MEKKLPGLIYTERLIDAIEALESLQDRSSFEHLTHDTAVEITNALDFKEGPDTPYVEIFQDDLFPSDLPPTWFPQRMWVHDLHGQMTELRESEQTDAGSDWSLSLRFAVTRDPKLHTARNDFTLISTPLETICMTESLNGDLLTTRVSAATGQQFLLLLLGSLVAHETAEDSDTIERFRVLSRGSAEATTINACLARLGQRLGTHRMTTFSYLSDPEQGDRALAIKITEVEDEGAQSRQLDYYLNSQLLSGFKSAEASHTAMMALGIDDIRHEGIVLSALQNQYAKRFATDIPLDELRFAVSIGLFDQSEQQHFDPRLPEDHEQYGLIAQSIMTVIQPHLKRYLHYDF